MNKYTDLHKRHRMRFKGLFMPIVAFGTLIIFLNVLVPNPQVLNQHQIWCDGLSGDLNLTTEYNHKDDVCLVHVPLPNTNEIKYLGVAPWK